MRTASPIFDRQIQLDSALDLQLLSLCDISADGLRGALHGVHLLAAVIEASLLAY